MEKLRSRLYAPFMDTVWLHQSRGYRVDAKTITGIEKQVRFEGGVVVRIEELDEFVDIPFGVVLVDYGNEQAFTVIGVEDLGKKGFSFKAGWFSSEGLKRIVGHLQNGVEMAVGVVPSELDKKRDALEERGFWILEPSNQAGEAPVSIAVVPGKLASDGPRNFNGIYFSYENSSPMQME